MNGDFEPRAVEAAAHEDYEESLAALEAARIEGNDAEIRRLERELEDAKRRWHHAARQVRGQTGTRRSDNRQRDVDS